MRGVGHFEGIPGQEQADGYAVRLFLSGAQSKAARRCKHPPDKRKQCPAGAGENRCGPSSVVAAVVGADGAGAVAEPAAVVRSAVGHIVVDMAAGHIAALHGAQGGAGAVAVAALMVITAVHGAVMHMAAGKRAAFHCTDRYLLRLGAPAVTTAAPPVVAAVRGGGSDQQAEGKDTHQTGEEDALEPHNK